MSSIKEIATEFMALVEECEQLRSHEAAADDEARLAFTLVLNDYLWRVQGKMGQLWYRLCEKSARAHKAAEPVEITLPTVPAPLAEECPAPAAE